MKGDTRHIADKLIRVRPMSQPDDFVEGWSPETGQTTRDYLTLCGLEVNSRYIGISDAEPNCPTCLKAAGVRTA